MAKLGGVVCVVLMCMLVVALAPHAVGAISCGQVVSALRPCLLYLQKGSQEPGTPCCNGIRYLNAAPDRQGTCNCLKSLAGSVKNIDANRAAGLPGKCGVNVGYEISTKTDCSKVH